MYLARAKDVWKDSGLIRKIVTLSLVKNKGPLTAYAAAQLVYGTAGYAGVVRGYFLELEKEGMLKQTEGQDRGRKPYIITDSGLRFLEEKKQAISTL